MATRRWSINPGDRLQDVVEAVGAATVTKMCEVTLDMPTFATVGGSTGREQAVIALRTIIDAIIQDPWPPQ